MAEKVERACRMLTFVPSAAVKASFWLIADWMRLSLWVKMTAASEAVIVPELARLSCEKPEIEPPAPDEPPLDRIRKNLARYF